jgi:hypothetical protein
MIGQGEARGCGMKGRQCLGKTEWSKVLFRGWMEAIGTALDTVTEADVQGFFAHCYYRQPVQLL